jgi:hypothetical protein
MTSNPMHAAPASGYSQNDDRLFAEFLRLLELPWHPNPTTADIQKSAFSALIATYDTERADRGFVCLVAQLLSEGANIEGLRTDFARAAGITDLAMLRFFSTLDASIAAGEISTIDITHLSDEEFLKLLG